MSRDQRKRFKSELPAVRANPKSRDDSRLSRLDSPRHELGRDHPFFLEVLVNAAGPAELFGL